MKQELYKWLSVGLSDHFKPPYSTSYDICTQFCCVCIMLVTLAIVAGKCDAFSHSPGGCCTITAKDIGQTTYTVYPKKYAHGFVVLCFVVVMQSFIMNSHDVFIHIHQGCFAGTGAIVRLPQCQWSKPDGYGKISQCITTTKHNKTKTVCIFLGIYTLRQK